MIYVRGARSPGNIAVTSTLCPCQNFHSQTLKHRQTEKWTEWQTGRWQTDSQTYGQIDGQTLMRFPQFAAGKLSGNLTYLSIKMGGETFIEICWCSVHLYCSDWLNQNMIFITWRLKCDYAPWQSCIHPARQLLITWTLLQDGRTTPTLAVLVQTDNNCILTNQTRTYKADRRTCCIPSLSQQSQAIKQSRTEQGVGIQNVLFHGSSAHFGLH